MDSNAPASSTSVASTEWRCPFCFEFCNEEDNEDWVMCGCGKWTHELCIADVVIDAIGK